MNFLNHETQLALRLADPNNSLLLKLIFFNSFEVITGFTRLLNQRTWSKTQFLASTLGELSNIQLARARWVETTSCKNVIWGDVGRRSTRPRAIPLPLTKIFHIDGLPFFLTHGALLACARGAPLYQFLSKKNI